MTTTTRTSRVMLNAPPEAVFKYVSDLTKHPEWSGGPLKVEAVSTGPVAVGSTYHSSGGETERPNDLRVTQLEPPTRFTFVATDPAFGDVLHEFTFQAQSGGTLMERAVTSTSPPVVAFLFRAFLYPRVGKPLMDKAMAKLKAKFEQGAP
jgi:uncharacterized protein YndB with AHSA1/START domain